MDEPINELTMAVLMAIKQDETLNVEDYTGKIRWRDADSCVLMEVERKTEQWTLVACLPRWWKRLISLGTYDLTTPVPTRIT